MKVSFLVTCYNQKQYVAKGLESIIAIKKPYDWEILIGDDGSTDGTVEVINEYIKKYPNNIFLYIMPRDQQKKYSPVKRAGTNKLNILEHATGDFFCNLDGDDFYCDSDFVVDALEVMAKNATISVVAFGYKYVIDGIDGKTVTLPVEGILDTKKYLRSFYTHVGACVLRLIKDESRLNYIKNMGFFDDNSIVANNLYYGDIWAVPRVIHAYRQTGGSIINSMNIVDQFFHNTQGYDIDVKLVPEENRPDVLQRYAYSIIGMYLYKNKLRGLLGENRYTLYLDECAEIPDSLAWRILAYGEATESTAGKQTGSCCL